jgi:hypothetical protein
MLRGPLKPLPGRAAPCELLGGRAEWGGARTMAMMVPNTQDLIMDVMTSQLDTARVHESRMMLALTSYTVCASRQLHAMPGAARGGPLGARGPSTPRHVTAQAG